MYLWFLCIWKSYLFQYNLILGLCQFNSWTLLSWNEIWSTVFHLCPLRVPYLVYWSWWWSCGLEVRKSITQITTNESWSQLTKSRNIVVLSKNISLHVLSLLNLKYVHCSKFLRRHRLARGEGAVERRHSRVHQGPVEHRGLRYQHVLHVLDHPEGVLFPHRHPRTMEVRDRRAGGVGRIWWQISYRPDLFR